MNAALEAEPEWLRCTAFEELMLKQDSYEYPCVICVRLDLSRTLDAAHVQQALQLVAERHPLLRATLVRRASKLWWGVAHTAELTVETHGETAPQWPPAVRFDLEARLGCHVDIYPADRDEQDGACVLFWQIHHALADGLGCLAMVQDLFQFLASSPSDHQITDSNRPVRAAVLKERNRFGLTWQDRLKLVPSQLIGLAGVRQFLMRQPVPLVSVPVNTLEQRSAPNRSITACSSELSRETVARLKEIARLSKVSLNDMLAATMFAACHHSRHADSPSNQQATDWLRMMIPISLRDRESAKLPACNIVTCIFLDRTGQQIADSERLLASIHEEMELIKRHRLGLIFIFSIWVNQLFTRWRRPVTAQPLGWPKRCQTTCVFSNMGRILRRDVPLDKQGRMATASLVLENIQIIAPTAPWMQAAVTAIQYAGTLTLSLNYDAESMGTEKAEKLLADFVQRLENLPLPVESAREPARQLENLD